MQTAWLPARRSHLMSGVISPVSSTSFLSSTRQRPFPQSSILSRTRACRNTSLGSAIQDRHCGHCVGGQRHTAVAPNTCDAFVPATGFHR